MIWNITLSPTAPLPGSEERLSLSVNGMSLSINEDVLDLTGLQNGDVLPMGAVNHRYIRSDLVMANDQISVTLRFPVPHNAPHEAHFPLPIVVTQDGSVTLPSVEPEVAPT